MTCYLSRTKTGGIKGGLGLAEDTSDAVISCQQVGPITLSDKIKSRPEHGSVRVSKTYIADFQTPTGGMLL